MVGRPPKKTETETVATEVNVDSVMVPTEMPTPTFTVTNAANPPRQPSFTEVITRPFPKDAIRQRDGGRGATFNYIEGQTAIRRMIEATNNIYSFEILNTELHDHGQTRNGAKQKLMLVWGRLHANGSYRDNVGVQVINENGGEDLYKGAITDCFKRCAMMFGMALELYGDDYENPIVTAETKKAFMVAYEKAKEIKIASKAQANEIAHERFGKYFDELKDAEVLAWIDELSKKVAF